MNTLVSCDRSWLVVELHRANSALNADDETSGVFTSSRYCNAAPVGESKVNESRRTEVGTRIWPFEAISIFPSLTQLRCVVVRSQSLKADVFYVGVRDVARYDVARRGIFL